jgi:hypothetical protein
LMQSILQLPKEAEIVSVADAYRGRVERALELRPARTSSISPRNRNGSWNGISPGMASGLSGLSRRRL